METIVLIGVSIAESRTPRQKAMQIAVHNLRYGREYSVVLLVFMIGAVFASTSPVILPLALIYFWLDLLIYRYQVLYVYESSYESGGLHWPFVFNRIVWCLWLYTLATACMLIFNGAYVQGGLLIIAMTPALYNFNR